MFIQTHDSNNDIKLTFIKSVNVQAYPCSRRRSELLTKADDSQFYFPFDPEARLNTEANNRKTSSLNGYTQTYIQSWNTDKLVLSLAGYLFTITLPSDHSTPDTFGSQVTGEHALNDAAAKYIYANILLEDVYLYTGFTDYYTSILRNQSDYSSGPAVSLDLLRNRYTNPTDFNECYFSGLSFSTTPLTANGRANYVINTSDVYPIEIKRGPDLVNVKQTLVSLCILEKKEGTWQVYQPAFLPKIKHGDSEDSVIITGDATLKSNLYVEDNINVGTPANPATDNNGGNIVAKNNITAEKDLVAKQNLYVDGTIFANKNLGDSNNIEATKANIDALTGTTAVIDEITGTTVSSTQFIQNDNPVPIIDVVKQTDGYWQLQLTRVSVKN